jgi:hypothetical protein
MKEIHDDALGRLRTDGDFLVAAQEIPFLGKEVEFYIHLENEDRAGVSDRQRAAIQSVLDLPGNTKDILAPAMFDNYLEARNDMDPEPPLIETPGKVWDHVKIINVIIPVHGRSQHRYFFADFRCDWEEEHGLELLFRDGQLIRVSQPDGLWGNAAWYSEYINE